MSAKVDVLGCGCVAVDDLLMVDAYPPVDARVPVRRWERHCGGLTATALVAAVRLGSRCRYVGVVGRDELSEFALAALRREGIDVTHVRRSARARPVHAVIVVSEKSGTRNIFFQRDPSPVDGTSRSLRRLIQDTRVLFVDDVDVESSLAAARIARKAGIPVVADCENGVSPRCGELLKEVGHLILSLDVARRLVGAVPPSKLLGGLWSKNREVVVVTDGAKGCWYLEGAKKGRICHQRAFRVKAVDTTGCGDVFHGAYASALARGAGLVERLRFASAVAALKATRRGGQQGVPDRNAVERFLEGRP